MLRSKYIRLFVSSTFEDMVVERDILQKKVFPRISELCLSKGWLFEDMDLRWGISQEASLQQKTMQICLDELKKCQQFSPKPNFLILQGDRIGWIPIPESIPCLDAEKILSLANSNEESLFNVWYRYDENSIEGEYILQSRNGVYLEYSKYEKEVETPLRQLFAKFAKTIENEDKRLLYKGSATMQEIYHGALSVPDADKHVILYSRTLTKVPKEELFKYGENQNLFLTLLGFGSDHRKFKESLKTSLSNVIEKQLSYKELFSNEYAREFEEAVYTCLERIVLTEIEQHNVASQVELDKEMSWNFIAQRNSFFVGRDEDIHTLMHMICNPNGKPIAITGQSGVGKSSLVSKLAKKCSEEMIVISRFIGYSFSRASGMELLRSIWQEMDMYCKYNAEFSIFNFSERIQKTSYVTPILIIIDGIDQLSEGDEFLSMHWLPEKLEGNIRVLYSVLDRDEYIHLFQRKEVNVHQLLPFNDGNAMNYIELKLKSLRRKLTHEQYSVIKNAVNKSNRLPIYLNIVSYFVSHLRSYDQVSCIPSSTRALLYLFFDTLSTKENHGELLVKKVLSYMVSAKYGISHAEIRELLYADDDYRTFFLQSSKHEIAIANIPSVVVVRLLNDLNHLINQQSIFDRVLIYLNHRIVFETACEWIKDHGCGYAHEELFRYYDSKWRKNDLHAIYEVSFQALKYNEHTAFELYTDLDYAISKIISSASDTLRSDLYNLQTSMLLNEDLRIFFDFDIEAKAYAETLDKSCDIACIKDKLYGFAANWAKGSIVRHSFERSMYTYPSMVNTMSPKDYKKRLFKPLPFVLNDNAVISDDGKYCIWEQNGKLYIYNTYNGLSRRLLSDHLINSFAISDDFSTLIAIRGNVFILYDVAKETIKDKYTISNIEINDLHVYFKSNNDFVVVFRNDAAIYKFYSESNNKVLLKHYPIKQGATFQIAGLLKDGDWIVLVMNVIKQENNEDRLYKNLQFYELADNLIYKYQFTNKWDSKIMHPFLVSCQRNIVLSSLYDKFEDVIRICEFTEDEIKMTDITLGCTWGRGHTYILHLAKDEKTFWSINGGNRLIFYDLKKKCNIHVINMHREYQMFKASADNRHLLLSYDAKGRYDTILCTENLTKAIDYFPSLLSTISTDAKAEHIFTSHGWDIQVNLDGAMMYDINPKSLEFTRTEYGNQEDDCTMFATCTAVSTSGERAIYSRKKIVEYIGKNRVNHYNVPIGNKEAVWPFYLSRIDYTPDESAILALSGDSVVSTPKNGYLFITGRSNPESLKYVIDLPKEYSFTRSIISNNGKYALVWSSDHNVSSFMGLLIDLTSNKLIYRQPHVIDMGFYPDAKASIQTVITELTTNKKYGQPPLMQLGVFQVDSIGCKDARLLKSISLNTALGDIAPSGRFVVMIDYSMQKGTRIYTSLASTSIFFNEYVNACRVTYDDVHMFVICDTTIYLVYIPEMKIVQKFQMNYLHDTGNRKNSFHFMKHSVVDDRLFCNKREMVHNGRHFKLYDKGLVISDWDHLFRIEPDGYRINETSFATISRVWNHRTEMLGEPMVMCPMCGKRFVPDKAVIDIIETLCKDIEPNSSPCLLLDRSAWDVQELKGHTCPHCRNSLRFNPFIS